MNSDSHEFYESYWENKVSGTEGTILRALPFIRFNTIRELLPREFASVLDVGCGEGTTLQCIKTLKNIEGVGIDIAETSIAHAKMKGLNAQVHNVEKEFPFQSELFDVVICSEVLEHLKFPHLCLLEIHRVLKKDGVAIMSIPNTGFVKARIRLIRGMNPIDKYEYHLSEHLHHWTHRGFQVMLLDFGFVISKILALKTNGIKGKVMSMWPSLLSDYLFYLVKKSKITKQTPRCSMGDIIRL